MSLHVNVSLVEDVGVVEFEFRFIELLLFFFFLDWLLIVYNFVELVLFVPPVIFFKVVEFIINQLLPVLRLFFPSQLLLFQLLFYVMYELLSSSRRFFMITSCWLNFYSIVIISSKREVSYFSSK